MPCPTGKPNGPLRMLLFDAFHDEYRFAVDFVPANALRTLLWQDVHSCIQLSAICAQLCFKYAVHQNIGLQIACIVVCLVWSGRVQM